MRSKRKLAACLLAAELLIGLIRPLAIHAEQSLGNISPRFPQRLDPGAVVAYQNRYLRVALGQPHLVVPVTHSGQAYRGSQTAMLIQIDPSLIEEEQQATGEIFIFK
jgi:hypothetical protein